MAEVKGKFITMACGFLNTKPAARQEAIAGITKLTGKAPQQLEPEGWYDTKVLQEVFAAVRSKCSEKDANIALRVIGQEVYYTIKFTVGLPPLLEKPVDFIKFEAEGFLANHRGNDIVPRTIVKSEDRHVIIQAPSPGYDCTFIQGVYEGILRLCHIYDGRVKQIQCIKNGDSTCEYDIRW